MADPETDPSRLEFQERLQEEKVRVISSGFQCPVYL